MTTIRVDAVEAPPAVIIKAITPVVSRKRTHAIPKTITPGKLKRMLKFI